MKQSPYTPPGARVADPPWPSPPMRPKQVTLGVGLLWASFALGIPLWYYAATRDPDTGFHPAFLALTLGIFAISAALNVLIYRGHNWARIVVLILFVLGSIFLLLPLEDPIPPGDVENALDGISFVVELIGLYFLFSWPGAAWFRPRE